MHAGCVLIAIALIMSGPILESTIFPTGTIVGTPRRAAALALVRVLLVATAFCLLVKRPHLTVVHLAALSLGSFAAAVVGSLLVQVVYTPSPIASGWKSTAPISEKNELGFRGRPISYSRDDPVVVLLGDSQVEARAMGMNDIPETRLERHLTDQNSPAKVFSLGAGGYGQDQQLLVLQEYLTLYRADIVLLWQTPSNDVWNNVFKTHIAGREPKPTFWLDSEGQLAGPSEHLGEHVANSPVVVFALWQRVFGLPWRDKRWELSLPAAYEPLDDYDGPIRTEWQVRWDSNVGRMRDENLDTEKSHLAMGLTPRSQRMQYGLDLTRALLARINDIVSRQNGTLVILEVATPDLGLHGDHVYVLNRKYYRVSERQLRENMDYIHDGFEVEIVPVTVSDWRVGPEDGHLNAHATDQVMAELAGRLRGRIRE